MAIWSRAVARVNATPRKLSRGTGATARGRHGLGYLDRGLAVLGKQKSEVGSSFPIEHLPCRGRDARHCEPYEVKVETGACAHGRAGSVVARTIEDDAPVRRIARRACRMQVSVSSMRPTRGRSGGRLVDGRESLVVMVSTGSSGASRSSLRASPVFTVEEQASHGRHPLAVSKAFRALPPTSQPSARPARNCQAYFWLPVARAHRELSGDVLAASGGQLGAEEWRRERRVRRKASPTR